MVCPITVLRWTLFLMDIRTFYAYIKKMLSSAFIPADRDHKSPYGAANYPDFGRFQRAHIRAVHHHIRTMARHYRRRALTGLIRCPESWLASPKPEVTDALIGRLKRALYVERQKLRAGDFDCPITTDGCHTRITALRIALCAELKNRRAARSHSAHQATSRISSRYERRTP